VDEAAHHFDAARVTARAMDGQLPQSSLSDVFVSQRLFE